MGRLDISLDEERTKKLNRLASRMHAPPEAVANSLLSTSLDEADSDPEEVLELLEAIPGAYERAQLGLAQAQTDRTVNLRDL